jgi:hypothetical protein
MRLRASPSATVTCVSCPEGVNVCARICKAEEDHDWPKPRHGPAYASCTPSWLQLTRIQNCPCHVGESSPGSEREALHSWRASISLNLEGFLVGGLPLMAGLKIHELSIVFAMDGYHRQTSQPPFNDNNYHCPEPNNPAL